MFKFRPILIEWSIVAEIKTYKRFWGGSTSEDDHALSQSDPRDSVGVIEHANERLPAAIPLYTNL